MNNEKTQKKRKFNFVDALIILLILAAVALVAFIFVFRGAQFFTELIGGGKQSRIYYAVEVPLVDGRIADSIDVKEMQGNVMTDSVKHTDLGKIAYVTVNEAEYIGGDEEGKAVASYYPDYKTVIVIIQNESSGFKMQVGKSVYMSSAHFTGEGHCLYIKEVEDFTDEALDSFMKELSTRQFSIENGGEQ